MSEPIVVALIVAIAPTMAVIASYFLSHSHWSKADEKLDRISVLVNGRMEETMARLAALEHAMHIETEENDVSG